MLHQKVKPLQSTLPPKVAQKLVLLLMQVLKLVLQRVKLVLLPMQVLTLVPQRVKLVQ